MSKISKLLNKYESSSGLLDKALSYEELSKWVKDNKRNLDIISSSELSKIKKRVESAEFKSVRPGYKSKFVAYKGQLHSIVEYGDPGVDRKMTILNLITGEEVTVGINDVSSKVPKIVFLGIEDLVAFKMGKIGVLKLEVAVLRFLTKSNGNLGNLEVATSRIDLDYYDEDSMKELSVDEIMNVYEVKSKEASNRVVNIS